MSGCLRKLHDTLQVGGDGLEWNFASGPAMTSSNALPASWPCSGGRKGKSERGVGE
jgi:hypothetical protein